MVVVIVVEWVGPGRCLLDAVVARSIRVIHAVFRRMWEASGGTWTQHSASAPTSGGCPGWRRLSGLICDRIALLGSAALVLEPICYRLIAPATKESEIWASEVKRNIGKTKGKAEMKGQRKSHVKRSH